MVPSGLRLDEHTMISDSPQLSREVGDYYYPQGRDGRNGTTERGSDWYGVTQGELATELRSPNSHFALL